MTNDEEVQLPTSSENDLVISDDSQALSRADSENEIPTLPTGQALSSHLPEPSASTSSVGNDYSPMTAAIFSSGTLPVGTTLGHFTIKSYIGGGGMGRVYLATDTALDRNVAIKVLPRQRAGDQGTVARFMNEARSAARLNHEHIAQVYFAGEQDGIPFIVFEYVEGTNVRSMVEEYDTFPLPQALNYLIQISHALAHASEHGVVHRDVKPSNILITREGRAKLIDMGLARLLDPSKSQDDLTASGVTLGTFDYISPEQARDPRNADIRSDIYSLGCTFFFMLAGRPPFPEGTVLQKLLQHQGDEPPDIRVFQPGIPAEVAVLIQKMMAKDPRHRFQTPATLIDALVSVAKTLGLQPTGPGKLVWVMTPTSHSSVFLKHLPWIFTVFLLLVVFFSMNLYWENRGTLPLEDLPPKLDPPTVAVGTTPAVKPPSPGKDETGARDARKPRLQSAAFYSPARQDRSFRSRWLPFTAVDSEENPREGVFLSASWNLKERFDGGIMPVSVLGSGFELKSPISDTPVVWTATVKRRQTEVGVSGEANAALEADRPVHYCVDPSGNTPDSFTTLAFALAESGENSVIELKWNNAMKVDPIMFNGKHLKMIAAENYHPILLFEPSDSSIGCMFSVGSCHLEIRDIAIEMRIQQEVLATRWSLFELFGTNRISLDRCLLTIRNKSPSDNAAYHDDVAFFRNVALPGGFDSYSFDRLPGGPSSVSADSGTLSSGDGGISSGGEYSSTAESASLSPEMASSGEPVKTEISLRMENSVMRGEATGLQCDILQAMDFQVESSLIALAKPFVQTVDSRKTAKQEAGIRIMLSHVTFFGRESFVRQSQNSYMTEPMRLEFDVRSSIIFLNSAPLAVFQGAASQYSATDYFKWTGLSNDFQSVTLGWRFLPDPSRSEGTDYRMKLDEWKNWVNSRYERDPHTATRIDQLRFEEIRKPTHRLRPRDLVPQFLSEYPRTEEQKNSIGVSPRSLQNLPSSWTIDD